ncbi:helix-turn-helix transcriptional regulator [Akkermansiaceae bacterium]|nr:helix-turn-helix transcriptional regulator [Akkermansiaceae bacterium]
MKSHEVLRELFEIRSPKQLASELGVSVSLIYKWAEPSGDRGSGTPNPLERIAALLKVTGDVRIAEWICRMAGGFYTRSPNAMVDGETDSVAVATNRIVQDFAGMLSSIATAAMDDRIDANETAEIRGRWENLKSVTETFVCCCEHGNFQAIRSAVGALRAD